MTLLAHFHDSVPSPSHELPALESRARTQEHEVLNWFKAHPRQSFSREEIEAIYSWPTQTCSRILANLTARGAIEKSGERSRSSYGRACNRWRLVRREPVQEGVFS